MKCTNSTTSSTTTTSSSSFLSSSDGNGMSTAGGSNNSSRQNISTSNYDSFRTDSGYNSSCSCQSISSSTCTETNISSRDHHLARGDSFENISHSCKGRTSGDQHSLGDSGLVLDCLCEESSLELNDLNKQSSSSCHQSRYDNEKVCVEPEKTSDGSVTNDSGLGLDLQECFSKLKVNKELDRTLTNVEQEDNQLLNRVQSAFQTPKNVIDNLAHVPYSVWNSEPQKRLQIAQDAYLPDKDGDTHLHLAVVRGQFEIILVLIYLAPHPSYLDLQNNLHQTALHLAVLTSQPRVVRRLVLAGASLDIRNRVGNTPLHLACERGDLDCVRELTRPVTATEVQTMRLSCPPYYRHSSPSVPQNLEIMNYEGQMCVHLAAIAQYPEIMRHLKIYGANINAQEGKGGRTPLCFAIEARNCNLVEFLVKECQADINASTYAGITPFQMACNLDPKIAELLSNLGACPAFYSLSDSDSDSDFSSDENMDTSEEYSNFFDLKINGEPLW